MNTPPSTPPSIVSTDISIQTELSFIQEYKYTIVVVVADNILPTIYVVQKLLSINIWEGRMTCC